MKLSHHIDTAVLLNANAKQVTARVHHALSSVVAQEHLFLSRDADEANEIADTVVARGYSTVFTGGGDGTFVSWVNRILDASLRRRAPAPRFGVLALGTGNAVAGMVGMKTRGHMDHLKAFLDGRAPDLTRLSLLTCDGRRTPFAGVGLDAAVLNDYNWVRTRVGPRAPKSVATGIPGYGVAAALRTVPRYLLQRRPSYCEVVNVGRPAHRLDGAGRAVGPAVRHGELLYAGPCMMAAAGTVPYYGFGLKAFPYAGHRPGALQLRLITQIGVPTVLWNLPSIWAGDFSHPSFVDFHAERVTVTFERPMPLQIGGDAEGWRESVSFGMAEESVDMVDFRRARMLH